MPDTEWLAYRKQQFADFRQQHELPASWYALIERAQEEGSDGQHPYQFDFDYPHYLVDERYIQIFTLDPNFGQQSEEGDEVHIFALWRRPGQALSRCPVIQSGQRTNNDGSCSPTYSQAAVADSIEDFLRLLATGIAGRDLSTLAPIAIDPTFFRRVAQPLDNREAALAMIEDAARRFKEAPRPRGWDF